MMFMQTLIVLLGLVAVADARRFGVGDILADLIARLFPFRPPRVVPTKKHFNRISHFLVCSQLDPTCNVDNETSAEIIVASKDGNTLYYSDSPLGVVGFVDISDPSNPVAGGILDMGGEPTSVAVVYDWILAAVNTSPNFTNPSGNLQVIDPESREVVRTFDLGGQVSDTQSFE